MSALLVVISLGVIGLLLWGALRKRPAPPESVARGESISESPVPRRSASAESTPTASVQNAPESARPPRELAIGTPHTIDAGGVKITAQLFVREKGTGEKRTSDPLKSKSRGKTDQDYFNEAFWNVVKGIEAPQQALKALSLDLYRAFESGDPRKERRAIDLHLPAGTWRWAAYEQYAAEQDQEIEEETAEDIETVRAEIEAESLQDLLQRKTVAELKGLYTSVGGASLKSRASKLEIADAIVRQMSPEAAEATRREIIAEALQSLAIQEEDDGPDYSEMAKLLAHRVTMNTYRLRRRDQMLEVTDGRPYWMFDAVDDPRTPERCKQLHGTILRHLDPFWQTHYPPCEYLFCRCDVRTLSERDVQKRVGEARISVESADAATTPALLGADTNEEDRLAWLDHATRLHLTMARDAWKAGDFAAARLSYLKTAQALTQIKEADEAKVMLKQEQIDFAKADPLYQQMIAALRPIVSAEPGILQTAIYGRLPFSREDISYALYFAYELGDLYRRKKGRTYEVLPAGVIIDQR